MHFTPVCAGTILLAVATNARVTGRAALASTEPLEITQLLLKDSAQGSTTLQLDVYNPDPLTQAKTTCSGSWPHNGAFPTDYELCQDGNFTWRLDDYTSIKTFTIGLTHIFKDPSVGDPPYDRVRVFAKASLNGTGLVVSGNGTTASQQNGAILYAPVYAITA